MLAGGLLALGIISVVAADGHEADAAALTDIVGAVDTAWLLIAGFLVFFMQAGFAMLTAGFVRSHETANILMKNMIDACVGGISFWLVGWAFAYGVGGASNQFIGLGNFALNKLRQLRLLVLPVRLRRRRRHHRGRGPGRAHEVLGLPHLHRRHHRLHLPRRGALGLGHEHVDGGLHQRRHLGSATATSTSPAPASSTPWAASPGLMGAIAVGARLGKYGPSGEVRAIPGHNIFPRHHGHVHPLVRLVRVQPGLHARPLRRRGLAGRQRGRHHHSRRGRGRHHRHALVALPHRPLRHRPHHQRHPRRARGHHRRHRHRGPLGRGRHRRHRRARHVLRRAAAGLRLPRRRPRRRRLRARLRGHLGRHRRRPLLLEGGHGGRGLRESRELRPLPRRRRRTAAHAAHRHRGHRPPGRRSRRASSSSASRPSWACA